MCKAMVDKPKISNSNHMNSSAIWEIIARAMLF